MMKRCSKTDPSDHDLKLVLQWFEFSLRYFYAMVIIIFSFLAIALVK